MNTLLENCFDQFIKDYFRKYPNRTLFTGRDLADYLRHEQGVYFKYKIDKELMAILNSRGWERTTSGYKKRPDA